MGSFVELDPGFPSYGGTMAAIILAFCVFDARRQRVVWGRLAAAMLIILGSWVVRYEVLTALAVPLFLTGLGIDQFFLPEYAKRRVGLVTTMVFALLLSVAGVVTIRGPKTLEITGDALVADYGTGPMVLPLRALRIVEFGQQPYRNWHLKDGVQVFNVYESDSYEDADSTVWTAREIIGKIEDWANVRRERAEGPWTGRDKVEARYSSR